MTATAQIPPAAPATAPTPWLHALRPLYRLVLRWAYIAVLTVYAFHRTLLSLVETTRVGGLNGYVWVVPLVGIMAAIGLARRERTELPIHDRQTDMIVGMMGLVLALMVHGILLQRYSAQFHLLRLDLLAMWLFVVSSSIILFGLRPVIRFGWVWLMMIVVFPLPYQITVILLGGSRVAAGGGTLVVAAVATAIAVGRSRSRGVVGAVAAWGVGLMVLMSMAVLTPNAPLLPALTSVALVGGTLFLYARRGAPKRVLDRKIEPLAAKDVWAGLPLVLAVAIALSLVRLPLLAATHAAPVGDMTFGRPLVPPVGWHITEERRYGWVQSLYGRDASLLRQRMVADTGNPRWDKFARPRTVIVDTTNTWRPTSLVVYPSTLLYSVSSVRTSAPQRIDLGHGVTGSLVTVVDDKLLVSWELITWTWGTEDAAQRVLVGTVDNHEPDAPFPQPNGALGPTLRTLFTVLFRGNAVTTNQDPNFKDTELLTQFARGLITAQISTDKEAP